MRHARAHTGARGSSRPERSATRPAADESAVAPAVADGILIRFLDTAAPWRPRSAPRPTEAACTRSPPRASLSVSTTRRPTSTTPRSGRRCTARSTRGSTSTARPPADYDDRDFRAEPPANGDYVLPQAPVGEAKFFRDATSQIQRRLVDNRTLEIQRNRSLKLYCGLARRPSSSPSAATRPARRRRTTRPRSSATGWRRNETGSRTRSTRPGAASRSSIDRAVAPDDRAHRRCGLLGARRLPRRAPQHPLDRELGGERGVTPRRSARGPPSVGEPRRRRRSRRPTSSPTSSRSCSTRSPRSTPAGSSRQPTSRPSRSGPRRADIRVNQLTLLGVPTA